MFFGFLSFLPSGAVGSFFSKFQSQIAPDLLVVLGIVAVMFAIRFVLSLFNGSLHGDLGNSRSGRFDSLVQSNRRTIRRFDRASSDLDKTMRNL